MSAPSLKVNDTRRFPVQAHSSPFKPIQAKMSNSLPQILCLHGGGTSSAIFFAQTRRLRTALQSRFTFLFADAPIESVPGPGVLPFFENCGPYYRWISGNATNEAERSAEIDTMNDTLEMALANQARRTTDIVGVIGFSQGAVAATLLLQQAKLGDYRWARLRFGILLSGDCRDDYLGMSRNIDLPSVHVHGFQDQYLPKSRMLIKHFSPSTSSLIEFEGGHHLPTEARDIDRLAALTIKASRQERSSRRRQAGLLIPASIDVPREDFALPLQQIVAV